MPEASDFGQDPNDHGAHDQPAHADWAGAFAALPQETPSADGWERLQSRLPAVAFPARKRWPLWLATAASLALVIAIPLQMQSTTTRNATINDSSAAAPSLKPVTPKPLIDAGTEVGSVATVPPSTDDTSTMAASPLPTPATTARVRKPRRDRYVTPSRRPIRTVAQPADTPRIASTETPDASATGTHQESLDSLYAQSAQLEGLLSLARNDHVSTGTAAALTGALIRQVADIDVALAQPDMSQQDRNDLWRTRVDTLRQLVGIETTQRLYAARGQQYEAALVSID